MAGQTRKANTQINPWVFFKMCSEELGHIVGRSGRGERLRGQGLVTLREEISVIGEVASIKGRIFHSEKESHQQSISSGIFPEFTHQLPK